MHRIRIRTFDKVRHVAVTLEQVLDFLMAYPRQQSRIINLVPVEIKDRQHSAVANGIEKLIDVPRGGERPCFGFAITDDCRNNQVGIVERGPTRVRQNIAQLATFVYRTRRFGSAVTADAAGKRKLFEKTG